METRFVPCEACGSEGRIYRGHPNDPNPTDEGPCPVCEGTGMMEVEVEAAVDHPKMPYYYPGCSTNAEWMAAYVAAVKAYLATQRE